MCFGMNVDYKMLDGFSDINNQSLNTVTSKTKLSSRLHCLGYYRSTL